MDRGIQVLWTQIVSQWAPDSGHGICVWCLPPWLWSSFGPIFPWCPPIFPLQNWRYLLSYSLLQGWNLWIPQWLRVKILLWVSEEILDFILLELLKCVWMYFIWWVSYEPIGAQVRVLWLEHVPHRLICFSTWSLVIDTALGCCGTICTEVYLADIGMWNRLWLSASSVNSPRMLLQYNQIAYSHSAIAMNGSLLHGLASLCLHFSYCETEQSSIIEVFCHNDEKRTTTTRKEKASKVQVLKLT